MACVGPSTRLIENTAREMNVCVEVEKHLVNGAMMVLIEEGNVKKHNEMVRNEVLQAAENNDVVVLAQGSMTVLLPELADVKKPVLTSPRLGIEYVREVLYREG